MLGKVVFVAILGVICAHSQKRFLFDNQQSNPFQSPFGGGGTAGSGYHPCTPQQGFCSLQCDYGYVKGPSGCDFCMCNTHHRIDTTSAIPTISPTTTTTTTIKQGTVLSTKTPTVSVTPSSPSSTTVTASITSTTLSPCVRAQLACASSCGSIGYLIDPTDCTFCLCKENLG